ncbi:hypothetical protein L3Y34_006924 [Caenorhabditis briggsae]|uniref:Nuclear receptor domain-containing protein n=1 Tax=Caenorhabditis briggsae TaxID=6238 RepID=A0AAE9CZG3_CAEBR|nr:hypothetical protein L3Y34_006924 [Caenorhabditis briggsae]
MAESSPEYCPASTSTSGGESSPESSESHRKIENCQVCGQKAHGLHFGAITCRACAAFFRRVAAGANFVIKCRKGGGKCEIVSNGRSCCKKCRLKKCKEMGMNIENFQYHRDPLSTSKQITPSMAMYLGRPEFIILCDPETARKSITTKIDLTGIIDKATKILMSDIKIPRSSGQNRLRKLSTASNIERFSVSADDDFHEVTAIGLKETMSFWEHDILTVAKWLTHFDEFQDLKPDLKLTFLKTIWSVWNRLEKLGRTTMFLKSKTAPSWDETPIFQANDVRINLKDLKLDIEWLSNYSVEQIAYYIEGVEILSDPTSPVFCQVCGLKAHGIHFGATTCRACAAFFRRVAAGANFIIKCRKGDGKCEILSNGRSCCKKCRLKKCKEIGMDIKNFQFDRDTINTSKNYTPSIAMFVGRPEFLLFCDPQSSSNITYVDLSDLLMKARKILRTCPKLAGRNRLSKMSSFMNLTGLRESQQSSFTLIPSFGYQESFSLWEHDLLLVTRWLTYFDEFRNLQPMIKIKILKYIWHIWNRLEKLA